MKLDNVKVEYDGDEGKIRGLLLELPIKFWDISGFTVTTGNAYNLIIKVSTDEAENFIFFYYDTSLKVARKTSSEGLELSYNSDLERRNIKVLIYSKN